MSCNSHQQLHSDKSNENIPCPIHLFANIKKGKNQSQEVLKIVKECVICVI